MVSGNITVHPGYNMFSLVDDLAVIKLPQPVLLNGTLLILVNLLSLNPFSVKHVLLIWCDWHTIYLQYMYVYSIYHKVNEPNKAILRFNGTKWLINLFRTKANCCQNEIICISHTELKVCRNLLSRVIKNKGFK